MIFIYLTFLTYLEKKYKIKLDTNYLNFIVLEILF